MLRGGSFRGKICAGRDLAEEGAAAAAGCGVNRHTPQTDAASGWTVVAICHVMCDRYSWKKMVWEIGWLNDDGRNVR